MMHIVKKVMNGRAYPLRNSLRHRKPEVASVHNRFLFFRGYYLSSREIFEMEVVRKQLITPISCRQQMLNEAPGILSE